MISVYIINRVGTNATRRGYLVASFEQTERSKEVEVNFYVILGIVIVYYCRKGVNVLTDILETLKRIEKQE